MSEEMTRDELTTYAAKIGTLTLLRMIEAADRSPFLLALEGVTWEVTVKRQTDGQAAPKKEA
jgi:hypothetical protein